MVKLHLPEVTCVRAPVRRAGWEMPVGILGAGTETNPVFGFWVACTPAVLCCGHCPPWNLCFTWRFVFAGCFGMKAGLHSAIIRSLMGGWRKPAEYNLSFAAFYKSTFDF